MFKLLKRICIQKRPSVRFFYFSTQPHVDGKTTLVPKDNEAKPQNPNETSLAQRIFNELDLPYNIYGNSIEIPPKSRFIATQLLTRNKIPETALWDHFIKILSGSIYSMAAQDIEFLTEYLEPNFSKAVLETTQNLLKRGYKIEAFEDVNGNFGEPISKACNILDMVMIRGVSIDRESNLPENQYHKYIDNEEMGLVIYTPLDITDPKQFIDPEKNKTMYDSYKKAVLRVLAEIKTNLRLRIIRPDQEEIYVPPQEYTWKHLAIFETQMKPVTPLKSSYKLENYMEWLTKFKFGVWRLADLDNYMMGNPLIVSQKKSQLYADEIFKGSKFDPKARIDLRNI